MCGHKGNTDGETGLHLHFHFITVCGYKKMNVKKAKRYAIFVSLRYDNLDLI